MVPALSFPVLGNCQFATNRNGITKAKAPRISLTAKYDGNTYKNKKIQNFKIRCDYSTMGHV